MEQAIALWRALRRPFARAKQTCDLFDGCAWETIDFGLLGCRRCGAIHNCYDGKCSQTEVTEDGVVCCLTGIVTTATLYASHEHSDNICVYTHDAESVTSVFEAHLSRIPAIIQNILSPEHAPNLHYLHTMRTVHRLCVNIMSDTNPWIRPVNKKPNSAPLDIIAILDKNIRAIPLPQNVFHEFNAKQVSTVIQVCSDIIHAFLVKCRHDSLLSTRPSELQSTVTGLLYVLRSGIKFEDIEIVPQVSTLQTLLPPANILERSSGVRAKVITEVENRIKFRLREMSRDSIRSIFS